MVMGKNKEATGDLPAAREGICLKRMIVSELFDDIINKILH